MAISLEAYLAEGIRRGVVGSGGPWVTLSATGNP